jgi:hypothetical protein
MLVGTLSVALASICPRARLQREGFVLDLVQDIRNINLMAMKARHTGASTSPPELCSARALILVRRTA